MAFNINSALMQLDPLKPPGPRPDKKAESMERQRLQLMREQFEEAKRQNVQDAEWRKIAEAGEMTRAQMASDRQAQHDQELAAAENIKQRTLAIDNFNKRVDSADYEGMDLDATRINQLGGLAELTGRDENGFPSYRLEFDAEEARKRDAEQEDQATAFFDDADDAESSDSRLPRESTAQSLDRMNALGYDTLGLRDNLTETERGAAEPLSTEDAFAAAQRAARGPDEPAAPADTGEPELQPYQPGGLSDVDIADGATRPTSPGLEDSGVSAYDYAGEADAAKDFAVPGRSTPMAPPPQLEPSIFQATGRPARGPAQRDIMGGVPKNVIDTGSMQDQRKQRLGPVMDNMVRSMPQAYQAGTRANADAALGIGLPADKAVDEALKLNAPANAAQASELEAERKREAAEAKAIEDAKLDPKGEQVLVKYGRDAAWKSFDKMKVKDSIGVMEGADEVKLMLSDGDKANDDKAVNLMMDLAKQVGAQSDADALRMTGGKVSTWAKVKNWLHEQIEGGYAPEIAASMKAFANDMREKQKQNVFSWLRATQRAMDKARHPLVGEGYLEVLDSQPSWLHDEWEGENGEPAADDGVDTEPAIGGARVPVNGGAPRPLSAAGSRVSYQAPPPSGGLQDDAEFMTSLAQNAEAYDVDPNKMLAIMGPESGGDPSAKNAGSSASGLIQMIDSVARGYINPRTNKNFESASELRELTRAEQAPIVAQYFADRGVTADSPVEDYALAVAAPAFVGRSAERDTVVYPKGSKEHAINRPWWPEDGGDVTVGSLLDFYLHKGKRGGNTARRQGVTTLEPAGGDNDDAEGLEALQ